MSSEAPTRERVHANALVIGEIGLLLRGASGSGKSALTLELIARARENGDFAALIGDDRVDLAACNGRLIARPHPAIAGFMEVRGVGLVSAPYEPAGVIHAVIDLTAALGPLPDRLPEEAALRINLCGLTVPRLKVRSGDSFAIARITAFIHQFMLK